MQIIHALLKQGWFRYDHCQGQAFIKTEYPLDRIYLSQYQVAVRERAPLTSKPRQGHYRKENPPAEYPVYTSSPQKQAFCREMMSPELFNTLITALDKQQ